jgi:putative tricarboxylic transport membrane protein
MKRDQAAGGAFIVLAGFVIFESRKLPFGSMSDPGPGYWPVVLAVALAAFGLAVILLGTASPRLAASEWSGSRKAIAILGACAFVALALDRLGYRLTMVAVVVFLLGVVERKHPLLVATAAVALSFGTHYLIDHLLNVPLPRGPWEL